MWNKPTKQQIKQIPKLYATENTPIKEKLIYLHFFIGGCDWYIAEFDGQNIFWGFAILNSDYFNAEWGYIPFDELKAINIKGLEIDCNLDWQVCQASKVEKICLANNW